MPAFPSLPPQTQRCGRAVRDERRSEGIGRRSAVADRSEIRFTGYHKFLDPDGYPAVAPPWGTLNAINLNTGEYAWKIPLGEYPELAAQGIKDTGTRELRRSDRDRWRDWCSSARRISTRSSARSTRTTASCCGKRRCRIPATRRLPLMRSNGRQFVVIAASGNCPARPGQRAALAEHVRRVRATGAGAQKVTLFARSVPVISTAT